MWTILFVIAVIIIPVGVLVYQVKRKTNEEWLGVLEDKKYRTHYHKGKKEECMLYFCKDSGEKVRRDVNVATYNSLNIGDRVQKSKGELYPVRIS